MLANEIGLSGKYVSERHYYASQEKMTAGEAAKLLTRQVGTKVLAKDVKSLYLIHYGHEPEWHHSGFYAGTHGKTMGRTWFVSHEELQTLADNYAAIVQKRDEQARRQADEEKRQRETMVTGFYWTWDYDYSGPYGKKRTFKTLHAYEGSEWNKPNNFTSCDPALLPAIRAKAGKKYFGWEEPKTDEFSNN